MTFRTSVLAAVASSLLVAPVRAASAAPPLRGVAVEERLDAEPLPSDLPANLSLG
jgi:hypothetical protein